MLHKINSQILLKTFEQDSTRYNFPPPPRATARNYDFNFRQFLALLQLRFDFPFVFAFIKFHVFEEEVSARRADGR